MWTSNKMIALYIVIGAFAAAVVAWLIFRMTVRTRLCMEKTIGEDPSKEMMNKLKEELTDCFIYLIILSNILEMDIAEEYFKKTKVNEKRFQKYLK